MKDLWLGILLIVNACLLLYQYFKIKHLEKINKINNDIIAKMAIEFHKKGMKAPGMTIISSEEKE